MEKGVQNKQGDISYWSYGDIKNSPLVMVHGFTGSHEGYQYIVPWLKKFYIIIPDLPGFGISPLKLSKYTIDELALQVNKFVADLKLSRTAFLVSHSMGGLVAASMLAQAPKLYNPLTVFISPVATKVSYLDSRKIGELLGRLQFYLGKTVPGIGPKVVKSRLISRLSTAIIITADQFKLKREIREHHFKNLDFISSINFYHQLHVDINKKGAVDYAPEINKKFTALIITGDRDNVTPLSTEKELADALTGSTLHVLTGVGHLLHYERPKEVAVAIDEFLRSS